MFRRKSPNPGPDTGATSKPEEKQGFFSRLRAKLNRGNSWLTYDLADLFRGRKIDAQILEELESRLLLADVGVEATEHILSGLQKRVARNELEDVAALITALRASIAEILAPCAKPLVIDESRTPFVILVVGVNGSGKTTSIGKLARRLTDDGHSVMLAAGDTFRAAAVEQLKIWSERTGAAFMSRGAGADAAGLAFDAIAAAKERGVDVVLIDTAGRLQNRTELMDELQKIVRVIKKVDETAPHAVLLVLDATVGQNALAQVDIFKKLVGVTGLVMTKLDGTARGGILVAIAAKFAVPIHFIGVGEGVDDLSPFSAREFGRAIAGLDS
jgi:fused signal recognition particle receptor